MSEERPIHRPNEKRTRRREPDEGTLSTKLPPTVSLSMHSSLREKMAFHFSPIAPKEIHLSYYKKENDKIFSFPGVFYRHFPREMYTHSIVEQAFLSARSSSSNNFFVVLLSN